MKTFLKCIAVAISLVMSVLSASAADTLVKKSYNVSAFNEIEVNGGVQVYYTQTSGTCSASLEISKGYENNVTFKQEGKKIVVKVEGKSFKTKNKTVILRIASPSLVDIELIAASSFNAGTINQANKEMDIEITAASKLNIDNIFAKDLSLESCGASTAHIGKITAGELSIDCSGASKTEVTSLKVTKLEVECSGASKATISGTADYADYDASGASKIYASKLKAKRGQAEASGAGKIESSIANLERRNSSGGGSISNR